MDRARRQTTTHLPAANTRTDLVAQDPRAGRTPPGALVGRLPEQADDMCRQSDQTTASVPHGCTMVLHSRYGPGRWALESGLPA